MEKEKEKREETSVQTNKENKRDKRREYEDKTFLCMCVCCVRERVLCTLIPHVCLFCVCK